MAPKKRSPVSLRYLKTRLKARLRVLKRPMVWGSAALLLVTFGFLAEYWANPNRFNAASGDRRPSSGVASLDMLSSSDPDGNFPSIEDSAIGIDIDSLPLLMRDFGPLENDGQELDQLAIFSEPVLTPEDDIANASSAPVPPSSANQSRAVNPNNPFSTSAPTPRPARANLAGTPDSSLNPLLSVGGMTNSFLNPGAIGNPSAAASTDPEMSLSSPLQTSIRQYSTIQPSQENEPGLMPTSGQTSPGQGTSLLNAQGSPAPTGNPLQPDPNFRLQTPQVQFVPRTSPPPGTTGYVLPPSLRSPNAPGYNAPANTNLYPGSSSSNTVVVPQPVPGLQPAPSIAPPMGQFNPNVAPWSSPGGASGVTAPNAFSPATPTIVQPQTVQQPQFDPLPQRRPGLGRPIGGGEINTFSNP